MVKIFLKFKVNLKFHLKQNYVIYLYITLHMYLVFDFAQRERERESFLNMRT